MKLNRKPKIGMFIHGYDTRWGSYFALIKHLKDDDTITVRFLKWDTGWLIFNKDRDADFSLKHNYDFRIITPDEYMLEIL